MCRRVVWQVVTCVSEELIASIFRLLYHKNYGSPKRRLQSIRLCDVMSQKTVLRLFFLWLYSPILGLGRLHETFRFISVTRSRTVGSIPWTGDQLVARSLLTAPGDCDDWEICGMNGLGRGNWSTKRKLTPTPLCSPQIPFARPRREPEPPQWEASE
jgi:hypothetical protein